MIDKSGFRDLVRIHPDNCRGLKPSRPRAGCSIQMSILPEIYNEKKSSLYQAGLRDLVRIQT